MGHGMQRTLATMVALTALSSCGGSAATDMGDGPPDMAQVSDVALCDNACARLVACGVFLDNQCSTNCQAGDATYKACLRAAASDCNAIALCIFKALAPFVCPGGGGVPAGTGTCKAAADCEGQCNATGAPRSCGCACVAAMSPTKTLSLLVNNSCADSRCAIQCGPPPNGNGNACNACHAQLCQAAYNQCAAQ